MPSGTELCLACGLCCTGVLHGRTVVAESEQGRLQNLGFLIVRVGDQLIFEQPCLKYDQNFCSIYTLRPDSCQIYQCTLLKRLLAGEVQPNVALSSVKQAKAMLSEVFAAMPVGWSIQKMREMLKNESLDPGELMGSDISRPEEAAAMLNFVMFSWHMNKNFR